jgi:NADH:ubiquinone oxidoreductase subunit H
MNRAETSKAWLPGLLKKPFSSPGWKTGAPAALLAFAFCVWAARRTGPLSPRMDALHSAILAHTSAQTGADPLWTAIVCAAIFAATVFLSAVSLWICDRTQDRLQSPAGAAELLLGWAEYPARWFKSILSVSQAPSAPGTAALLIGAAVFFTALAAPEPALEMPGAPLLWLLCCGPALLLAAYFFGAAMPGRRQQEGALRSLRQQSAFETARLIAAAAALAYAGGARQADALAAQSGLWFGAVPRWFVFLPVAGQLAFASYAAAAVALCQTGPFNSPRGRDIQGGWAAGARPVQFAAMQFARGAAAFLCAYCGAILFLGGAQDIDGFLPGWFMLALKTIFMLGIFGLIGAATAPCGLERAERFGWTKALPAALAAFVITGIFLCLR